jgi:hypothetical protein
MITPVLVTLDQFVAHAKLPPPPAGGDADLQAKIDAASEWVCHHIADRYPDDPAWVTTIEGWTPATAPPRIRLAVLELTSYLVRYLGDDSGTDQPVTLGYLPIPVSNLLAEYRAPGVA